MRSKCRADGELSRGRKGKRSEADFVIIRAWLPLAVWRSHPTVAIVRTRPLGTEEILSGGVFYANSSIRS